MAGTGADFTDADIRRRIERRSRRWMLLLSHMVLYVFVNLALWLMSAPDDRRLAIFSTTIWFAIVLLHAIRLIWREATDWAIKRELRRVYGADEPFKSKRSARLALSDDGELVDFSDGETPAVENPSLNA